MKPNKAPIIIVQTVLTLVLKVNPTATSAMRTLCHSTKVSFDITISTANITATAATFTASRKYLNIFDSRILGINGFNIKTNKKEGKNIHVVATNAPLKPES